MVPAVVQGSQNPSQPLTAAISLSVVAGSSLEAIVCLAVVKNAILKQAPQWDARNINNTDDDDKKTMSSI